MGCAWGSVASQAPSGILEPPDLSYSFLSPAWGPTLGAPVLAFPSAGSAGHCPPHLKTQLQGHCGKPSRNGSTPPLPFVRSASQLQGLSCCVVGTCLHLCLPSQGPLWHTLAILGSQANVPWGRRAVWYREYGSALCVRTAAFLPAAATWVTI